MDLSVHPEERPAVASVTHGVATRSLPHLRDHRVQDVPVLPGSFFIDTVLSLHAKLFDEPVGVIRHVVFDSVVVLSDVDSFLRVDVVDRQDVIEYAMLERGTQSDWTTVARLEVERSRPA